MESNNGPVDFDRTWSVIRHLYTNHEEKKPGKEVRDHMMNRIASL